MSVEEALKVLQNDDATRAEAFKKELEELCAKHGFSITARAEIILTKVK